MNEKSTLAILAVGRLLLSVVDLPDALLYDHQLTSPLTSWPRLQEGIYLFQHGIDPYSGSSFYHSPLYLALFSTILPNRKIIFSTLCAVSDILGAWSLVQVWRMRQQVRSSVRDGLIAVCYILNPYLLLPSLALSTSTFENTLTVLSLMFASQGQTSAALLCMSVLVQLSLPSVLLLPPIILLLLSDPVSHLAVPRPFTGKLRHGLPLLGEFLIYFLAVSLASTMVLGNLTWTAKTWGAVLLLPDLTPNPGLWWYFFTEMFDHFRPFFLMVFSMHLLIYVAPICIKFQHDLLYAAFILLGVLGTFKSYLTLADPGLFLSLIAVFPETFAYMRHPIVTTLLHTHASLLLPLFHHLWLVQGTGNANFFYASTLVFGLANGFALTDCIYSGLRIAIGEVKEGYQVVQE